MKKLALPSLLLLATAIASPAAITLLEDTLNQPSELTLYFPPREGEETVYHRHFSGWANKPGVMAVTYGDGFGKDKTGGMLCTAEKLSPEYNVVQFGPVKTRFPNLSFLTTEESGRFLVEFDAAIPEGKELQVHFNISPPKGMEPRVHASRLIFGRAVGTGKYERYVFSAASASRSSVLAFTNFLRDAGLNGTEEITLNLIFFLRSENTRWVDGDSFQLDNLRVSLADVASP